MFPSDKPPRIPSLLAALLLWPLSAQADPAQKREVRLVYVREANAAGCPDQRRFEEMVAERLGFLPFSPPAQETVLVSTRKDERRWVSRVSLTDTTGTVLGEKEISSEESCSDLMMTAAFVVSVLVDPEGAPKTERPAPAPASPVPIAWPEERKEPPRPPEPARTLAVAAGLEGVASVGSAPAPAVGGALFGGVRRLPFLVELDLRADLPASDRDDRAVGARTWVIQGLMAPCFATATLGACALASAGVLWGEAIGPGASSRVDSAFHAAVGGRFRAELAPGGGPLIVRLHVDLLAPLTRASFEVGGASVFRTPALAASLGLGAGVRFR
jgi:hypothetical protein